MYCLALGIGKVGSRLLVVLVLYDMSAMPLNRYPVGYVRSRHVMASLICLRLVLIVASSARSRSILVCVAASFSTMQYDKQALI